MSQPVPLPHAGVASQATAIEQSRAIAEVQAAVLVAQQRPRDEDAAIRAMLRSCSRPTLAAKAFFEFPRGGKPVNGPTVYLARELARIWGNIDYKVAELSRLAGQSEMLAIAWDLQTNARSSTSWIVPNSRRYTGGSGVLTEERDIYENNANTGARRVREQIFAVLPQWFTEDAQTACRATLAAGDGTPIEERRDAALAKFGDLGVTVSQLTERVGRPPSKWTPDDLASLGVTMRSIQKGEIQIADAFTVQTVTVTELRGAQPATPAAPAPAADTSSADAGPSDASAGAPAVVDPAPAADPATPPAGSDPTATPPAQTEASPSPEPDAAAPAGETAPEPGFEMLVEFPPVPGTGDDPPASRGAQNTIARTMAKGGVTADADRHLVAARLAGRSSAITSTAQLTANEAKQAIILLTGWEKASILAAQLDAILTAARPAPAVDEAMTPGTRAWHDSGHPREISPDGEISTVEVLHSGDCGICEQGESS